MSNFESESRMFAQQVTNEAIQSIKELRSCVERTLSEAPTADNIRRLEELHSFLQRLAEAIQPMLTEPLTELTRKRQERVLLISAICLLISQGLAFVTKMGIFGAELQASSSWAAAVAAAIVTTYLLIAFVASYVRDMRVHEAMQTVPAMHLDILHKQSFSLYADKLHSQLKASEAVIGEVERSELHAKELNSFLQQKDSSAAVAASSKIVEEMGRTSLAQAELKSATAERELIEKRLSYLFGAIESTGTVDRLRLMVELWVPVLISLLSIGMAVKYVLLAVG